MTVPDKQALRAAVLARRKALSSGERAARSASVCARVAALPRFAAARTVAVYAALGTEVDPDELALTAARAGKRLAWPRSGKGRALEFASCARGDLVGGPRGTLEPPPSAPAIDPGAIDLACVPGVAFDAGLRRLGRGGGHYDATLPLLSRALAVGLAFECQLVPEVPAEPHDARVDAVATEDRLLASGGEAG